MVNSWPTKQSDYLPLARCSSFTRIASIQLDSHLSFRLIVVSQPLQLNNQQKYFSFMASLQLDI